MPLYTTTGRNPAFVSNGYYYTSSAAGTGTSSALGQGNLRLVPWVVTSAITVIRIGADISVAGEAGSKLRLGIYTDDGSGRPNALVVDAGQLDGTVTGPAELTISTALVAGLYWIGGAVQSAATTQPTVRTTTNWTPPFPLYTGTSIPASNGSAVCALATGATGALPSTFTFNSISSPAPRVFVKVS